MHNARVIQSWRLLLKRMLEKHTTLIEMFMKCKPKVQRRLLEVGDARNVVGLQRNE